MKHKEVPIKFLASEIDATIYALENLIGKLQTTVPLEKEEKSMLKYAKRTKEKLLEIERIKFSKVRIC